MTPKIIGMALASAVLTLVAAIEALHARSPAPAPAPSGLESKIDQLVKDVAEIKSDVRVLKCADGFTGTDCPGRRR